LNVFGFRSFPAVALCACLALAGCVSTPQASVAPDAVEVSQTQSDLRSASRQLRDQYREAGWATASGTAAFGQLANMLLNGRQADSARTPVQRYLDVNAPADRDAADIFTALDTDLSTATSLAGTVAVHARTISQGGTVNAATLGDDLDAAEQAIASVARALEFFSAAVDSVADRLDPEHQDSLRARQAQLRVEFERLGEAADGIADRRRSVRNGIFS